MITDQQQSRYVSARYALTYLIKISHFFRNCSFFLIFKNKHELWKKFKQRKELSKLICNIYLWSELNSKNVYRIYKLHQTTVEIRNVIFVIHSLKDLSSWVLINWSNKKKHSNLSYLDNVAPVCIISSKVRVRINTPIFSCEQEYIHHPVDYGMVQVFLPAAEEWCMNSNL